MTKHTHRKLKLSTETLRALDEHQLSRVAGGRTPTDRCTLACSDPPTQLSMGGNC